MFGLFSKQTNEMVDITVPNEFPSSRSEPVENQVLREKRELFGRAIDAWKIEEERTKTVENNRQQHLVLVSSYIAAVLVFVGLVSDSESSGIPIVIRFTLILSVLLSFLSFTQTYGSTSWWYYISKTCSMTYFISKSVFGRSNPVARGRGFLHKFAIMLFVRPFLSPFLIVWLLYIDFKERKNLLRNMSDSIEMTLAGRFELRRYTETDVLNLEGLISSCIEALDHLASLNRYSRRKLDRAATTFMAGAYLGLVSFVYYLALQLWV